MVLFLYFTGRWYCKTQAVFLTLKVSDQFKNILKIKFLKEEYFIARTEIDKINNRYIEIC